MTRYGQTPRTMSLHPRGAGTEPCCDGVPKTKQVLQSTCLVKMEMNSLKMDTERFSIECRKIETKIITTAN